MTNTAREIFQRDLSAAPKLPSNVRLVKIRRRRGQVTLFWEIIGGDKPRLLTTQSVQRTDHQTARGAI